MDRRAFLRTSAAAALGLAAIPIASALRFWPGSAHAQSIGPEYDPQLYDLTEEEVIELTLNYVDSYADVLPGVNVRESLLKRLQNDKQNASPA